jgi:hypothetical protein
MGKSAHGLLLEELHRRGKAKTAIYEKLYQEWRALAKGKGITSLELEVGVRGVWGSGTIVVRGADGVGSAVYFTSSGEFDKNFHGRAGLKTTKGWRNFFVDLYAIIKILPPDNGKLEWHIQ